MASLQKKKGSRSVKSPTDNSLLSAYVDAPSISENSSTIGELGQKYRIGNGEAEKRNPHIIDDRQKPITKKNKNRKKRELQRKSQSEGQDSEMIQDKMCNDVKDDDVVDSWEDIQDAGPTDSQPPPPPEFVIDAKAVEERKRKESEEADLLAKKLEETSISPPGNQSKKSKQQNVGEKKKATGNAKKLENNLKKEQYNKQTVLAKQENCAEKKPTSNAAQPNIQLTSSTANLDEVKKVLAELSITINIVQQTFQNATKIVSQSRNRDDNAIINTSVGEETSDSYQSKYLQLNKKEEKTQEEIKAEREAQKQAKQTLKAEAKDRSLKNKNNKAENLVQNSANGGLNDENQKSTIIGDHKSKEEIKAEREAKKQAKQAARSLAKDNPPSKNDEIDNQTKGSENEIMDLDKNIGPTTNQENSTGKSKAELKAERRAKQEAQRAAKANVATQKSQGPEKNSHSVAQSNESGGKSCGTKQSISNQSRRVPDDRQVDRASVEKKILKKLASQNIPSRTVVQRKVKLFDHLHQYEREYSISKPFPVVNSHIHPSVLQLGLRYAEGTIQGSNARCLAFMQTMKLLVRDYKIKPSSGDNINSYRDSLRQFSVELGGILDTHIAFLINCRTHSVSMGNAIRLLKSKIKSIGDGTGLKDVEQGNGIEELARQVLLDSIDTFVDYVRLAAVQISDTACTKIKDGDVILTFGCSSLLREVFLVAAQRGRKFKVVVADGRPRFEGREMARHLVQAGIHTTYILVQSVSYIISEITKVFLGAHAVFANGCVMSRVGTSQIALIAKAQNVPVLVCCETYKFSEKVQTDSFVFNELGDPDDLVATGSKTNVLEDWRDLSKLCVLNLSYDVTPASLVDAIISEISVIPTTSVPVVLRLKSMDQAIS